MYFQHFIQCLKPCATFVKYCIGLCLNGFSKQKIQFIQSQHIISESKSQYNWSGKFNQPFCSREPFKIMNLLSRYLNFLICTSSSSQRQLRYIEWNGVKIYDFQKVSFSTLFKLHIAGLGVLIPKRYHMLG